MQVRKDKTRKDFTMKKTLLLFLLLVALVISAFSSCKTDGGDKSDNGGQNNSDNNSDADSIIEGDYIYQSGSKLVVLISSEESSEENSGSSVYSDLCNEVYQAFAISDAGVKLEIAPDTAAKAKREIMIGRCDRELSRQAYRMLEKMEKESDELSYLIYSNGSSVAIAYDDDYEIAELAVKKFISEYVDGRTSLVLNAGYEYRETINVFEYYRELGEAELEAQWDALRTSLVAEYTAYYKDDRDKALELVDETMKALRNFYSVYDKDALVEWFANLYEPYICVCNALHGSDVCLETPYCGGAGFYFSNGGRDTLGFMPDLESTSQTFGFLKNSGMLGAVGNDISKAFPDGEAEKIVKWVKAMQLEDNGYFYHPQWSIQESNANIARIGRDLGHAVSILSAFKATPNYDTPSGVTGEGDSTLPTSSHAPSKVNLTGRLGKTSSVLAASKVVSVADSATPSHMLTEEAWRKYLNGLNIRTDSYLVANEISSSSSAILARDAELRRMGANYSLVDILMEWFAKNQNPDTGTWHWGATDDVYYANNGVLKIIATYQSLGREFPNPLKAIENAISAIIADQPINHVCDLYNTWFAVYFICNNVREFGSKEDVNSVIWRLREIAPEAIQLSAEKMSVCLCNDGSFSYVPGKSSTSAQGLPVAPPGISGEPTNGDVNATVICTYGNINYMISALGFSVTPKICTDADRRYFISLISEMDQVIKNAELDPYNPKTFDDFNAGNAVGVPNANQAPSGGYTFLCTDSSKGSYLIATSDPRKGFDGNVMQFHSGNGSWDRFIIPTQTGIGGDTIIFESDMCFESVTQKSSSGIEVDVTDGSLMQLVLGSGENATAGFYALNVRVDKGEIRLCDMSSSKDGAPSSQYTYLGGGYKYGDWFYVRLEHYTIDEKTVRVKVYLGDSRETAQLVAVSDNFFDYYANKIDNINATPPAISVYMSSMLSLSTNMDIDVLFDNLTIYKKRVAYTKEELPLNKNVDGPDQDALVFDFDDGSIPEGINLLSGSNTAVVNNGSLLLQGGNISVPANYRTSGANVASLSADILWNSGSSNLLSVTFKETQISSYNVIGFDFKVKTIGGVDYLVMVERMSSGTAGSTIDVVRIEKGVPTNIRIDFYHTENVALIYVDGIFKTASDATYANIRPRFVDSVEISSGGSVFVDNLVFERMKFDFTTAVEPDTPSDFVEFESTSEAEGKGAILSGVSVNGTATFGGNGSFVKLPLVQRSAVTSAYLVQFTVVPGDYSGKVIRPAILDADGNIIVAVDISLTNTTDGIKVEVFETGMGGGYDLVIGKQVVAHGKDVVITLSWFPTDAAANVEVSGTAIASTTVCYDVDVSDNEPAFGAVYSISNVKVAIDNMISESLYKYRTPVTYEGVNAENGAEKLTYDYSTESNLPKALTYSLKSGGSAVRIAQAFKKIGSASGVYSKALMLESRPGSNDEFTFTPSNTTSGARRVVFETEMMISSKSTQTTLFQVMMTTTGGPNGNKLLDGSYMFTLGVNKNGEVYYTDSSSTGKDPASGDYRYESGTAIIGKVDEWFKLRVEYYQGDKDGVRIVVTVNDGKKDIVIKDADGDKTVNKLVSNNYFGYRAVKYPDAVPQNNIQQVLFYGQSGPTGIVYMDNTTFYGDNASFIAGDINFHKELK